MEFTSRRRLPSCRNFFYLASKISISFAFLLFAFPCNVGGEPVPDTGQTTCYDDEGNIIECRAQGSPLYGQDANYNINAPSFTKLDAYGNALPDSEASWVMVKDNIAGLVWEVKNFKDGNKNYDNPHDADNTYTWYDANPETNGGEAGEQGDGTDTEDFIREINNADFGGYSDWRLPTIRELRFIADYGRYNPSINTSYFPDIPALYVSRYWSSTTDFFSSYNGLGVDFSGGYIAGNGKAITGYVRAVRGGQSTASSLEDIICGLQILAADVPQCCCKPVEDVNNDGKTGLAEIIHLLQIVSGLR